MSTAATDAGNASHAQFILNAFSHIEDGKINWTNVAADNNIGYARNATAKFNNIAKSYGFKYEGGKVVKLDGEDASGSAPVTPKTSRKKKSASGDGNNGGSSTAANTHSNKKRKIAETVKEAIDVDEEA